MYSVADLADELTLLNARFVCGITKGSLRTDRRHRPPVRTKAGTKRTEKVHPPLFRSPKMESTWPGHLLLS